MGTRLPPPAAARVSCASIEVLEDMHSDGVWSPPVIDAVVYKYLEGMATRSCFMKYVDDTSAPAPLTDTERQIMQAHIDFLTKIVNHFIDTVRK
jgi:hypothetical protein